MQRQGLLLGLLETLFEFYEGVFKLTVFLPFTLLQAWQLSRSSQSSRLLQLERSPSPPPQQERQARVSWDKDALPKHSILKTAREETGKEAPAPAPDPEREDIANKLELIGREIERISDLLSRTGDSSSSNTELEIELRSTSFQDLKNVFQQRSEDINQNEAGAATRALSLESKKEVELHGKTLELL